MEHRTRSNTNSSQPNKPLDPLIYRYIEPPFIYLQAENIAWHLTSVKRFSLSDFPIKTHNPVGERLESKEPAQSAYA